MYERISVILSGLESKASNLHHCSLSRPARLHGTRLKRHFQSVCCLQYQFQYQYSVSISTKAKQTICIRPARLHGARLKAFAAFGPFCPRSFSIRGYCTQLFPNTPLRPASYRRNYTKLWVHGPKCSIKAQRQTYKRQFSFFIGAAKIR